MLFYVQGYYFALSLDGRGQGEGEALLYYYPPSPQSSPTRGEEVNVMMPKVLSV
jgi:hypothetical protein